MVSIIKFSKKKEKKQSKEKSKLMKYAVPPLLDNILMLIYNSYKQSQFILHNNISVWMAGSIIE